MFAILHLASLVLMPFSTHTSFYLIRVKLLKKPNKM